MASHLSPAESSFEIRPATTDVDAAAVERVLLAAFLEFKDVYTKRAFAATAITADEVRRRIEEGPVWVAVVGSEIVGTVSAVKKADEVYVRGMAVVPSTRGRAMGRRLLDQVEQFAVANGCQRLSLMTTPFLVRAIQLYERAGFVRAVDGESDLFGTPLFAMTKKIGAWSVSIQTAE
jgi:GNAT superfamily N-acetyltransferase